VRGAVTALRLGTVQLCRVSRDFSTRATGEDFEASFLCLAWPWGNLQFGCFHWACARGALTRALACTEGCCGHPNGLLSSSQGLVQLLTGYQTRPYSQSLTVSSLDGFDCGRTTATQRTWLLDGARLWPAGDDDS
jgi:hypothetical protein